MSDLVKRLRIVSQRISMGDKIRWGQETSLMNEAADAIEMLQSKSPEQCETCGDSDCDKPRECVTGDGV